MKHVKCVSETRPMKAAQSSSFLPAKWENNLSSMTPTEIIKALLYGDVPTTTE